MNDLASVARVLSEIAHALESTDGAPARIERCLELVGKLVPTTRAALLGTGSRITVPALGEPEKGALFTRLSALLDALSDEDDTAKPSARPTQPGHAHLALPVVGADALQGLLYLEHEGSVEYDEQAVRLASVVAAQLGAYLASLKARERDSQQQRELEKRHEELLRLNQELTDSYRGIITLHSELEDRADLLQRTSEVKSRVMASVSHEYRTPLHSILGMVQLLTDRTDGPLSSEQEKQVRFIKSSAEELLALVNDLLDLTKLEVGKFKLRAEKFSLGDFFASMRGSLKPLLPRDSAVKLVFEEPHDLELETDKAKLSQILRNLVSNALKFTEHGEVRVRATRTGTGPLQIEVRDTGIGISFEDLPRVFEEFAQVQDRVKGTGLGLSLSRKLAEILGGQLEVQSEPGQGSVFTVSFPVIHPEVAEMNELAQRALRPPQAGQRPVLVVEDDRKALFLYEKYLTSAGFHVTAVRSTAEAREVVRTRRPAAVVLDIMLEGETTWQFLADIKRDPATHDIPVLVVTVTDQRERARALGADEFWLKPIKQERLLKKLDGLIGAQQSRRVLVIDDDEQARYLVKKHLHGSPYEVLEAATGPDGVRAAHAQSPHVILLDFLLHESTAFDVLDDLKANPDTRNIPVIIVTSQVLAAADKTRLLEEAEAVISKQSLSRELAINRIRDALVKAGVERDLRRPTLS